MIPVLSASADQTARKMKHEMNGHHLAYWLHVPEGEAPDKGWPLVLFLHGAGERGDDLEKVKVHGPPKLTAKVERLRNAVVISPQCRAKHFWNPEVLRELLNEVMAAHEGKINKQRLYCTGLSMGGYGTWNMLAKYPDLFAAAAPICGGGEIRRLPIGEGLGIEGAPHFEEKELLRAKHLPIRAYHGADDGVVPQKESELLVKLLKENGAKEVTLTSYPGVGHDSWTRTYDDPEFWKWLFAQKKAG